MNHHRKNNHSNVKVIAQSSSSTDAAVKVGLNQTDLITVVARNSILYLYVNGTYIISVNESELGSQLNSGMIGMFSYENTNSTEVAFDHVRMWTL